MQVLRGPQELVLVRHAESRGNVADREARKRNALRLRLEARDADMPLSDIGLRQAEAVGRHLASQPVAEHPTAVLSSPYVRASSTALALIGGAGLELPLQLDERLRERELGAFDGMTGEGIRRSRPDEAERRRWLGKFYYRPPSGESWADVVLRVRQLMLNVSVAPAGYERLWIVTHQAVILAFRTALEGLTEREILDIDREQTLPNCSLTRYRCDADGRWHLEAFADASAVEGPAPRTEEPPHPDTGTDDLAASR
jgi:broad specificity phosphatase PhoE